jgi:hypothetical protein
MEAGGRFLPLAHELSGIASDLRAGIPVRFSRIARALGDLGAAWDAACAEAEAEGVPTQPRDRIDLPGLRAEREAATLRRHRAAAAAAVSRLLQVGHQTEPEFAPLAEVRRATEAALAAIESGAEADPIVTRFQAAATLIEQWNILPDSVTDMLHDTVSAAFGGKFAIAATRGRLFFGAAPPPVGHPPPARVETPTSPEAEPETIQAKEPLAGIAPVPVPAPPSPAMEPVLAVAVDTPPDPAPAPIEDSVPPVRADSRPQPAPMPVEPDPIEPAAPAIPVSPVPAASTATQAPASPAPIETLPDLAAIEDPEPPSQPPAETPAPAGLLEIPPGPEPLPVEIPPPASEPRASPPSSMTWEDRDPVAGPSQPVMPAVRPEPIIRPPADADPIRPAPQPQAPDPLPPPPEPAVEPILEPPPEVPAEPVVEAPPPEPEPEFPVEIVGPGLAGTSLSPEFVGPFIARAYALYSSFGSLKALRAAIARNDAALGPLAHLSDDETRRRDALMILDAWELIQARGARETPVGLQTLFSLLGFAAPQIRHYAAPPKHAVDTMVTIECGVVDDRDTVMVPAFGSAARGRYRIVLAWERLSFQHLLRRIGAGLNEDSGPVIILCFRAFDRAERLALARHTQRDPSAASLVVLDELALLFAAQHPGNRLKAMFESILPFCAVDAYAIAGDSVPSELFLGRRRERAEIAADGAANILLVTGGRQVGKTALLKRLVGDYAADIRYRIGAYLDIARIGVDPDLPPGAIVRLIAEALRGQGLHVADGTSLARFEARLGDWLNEPWGGGRRRVLVALDDADGFVRADSQAGYPELRQIKGLMQRLGRLFRLVIGGGREVQRMARDPRAPLADIAGVAAIGPVLRGEDLVEAGRLIRQPMETLGFSFSDALQIDRLLAHAGNDPCLIPPLCHRLLAEARRESLASEMHLLPYPVRAELVDRVCAADRLEARLTAKVGLTLDLDPRYAPACRAVAAGAVDRRDRVLLEELVDFGLLRRIGDESYGLDNPNVRRALEQQGSDRGA